MGHYGQALDALKGSGASDLEVVDRLDLDPGWQVSHLAVGEDLAWGGY